MMHGHEKSDPVIVAEKPANKAEQPFAEQSVKGANRGGGGGAKGGDQGKCGPAKHVPGRPRSGRALEGKRDATAMEA